MPKKELEPIRILIDEYDSRTPEDIFSHELRQSKTLYGIAAGVSRIAMNSLVVSDPYKLLGQIKNVPVVHAPRHFDFMDIPLIGSALREKELIDPYYLTMAELLGVPEGTKNPIILQRQRMLCFLIGHLGGIPVDRFRALQGIGNKKLLKMCSYVLAELQKSMVIFPEGGHADSRTVGQIGTGAADIAKMNGSPLVIWGLAGTEGATKDLYRHRKRLNLVAHVNEVVDLEGGRISQAALAQKLQAASDTAFKIWEAA
jgi:hypothetical protein